MDAAPVDLARLAQRAQIVLGPASGESNSALAVRLRVSRGTVAKGAQRFVTPGRGGLREEPRPGAPRRITDEDVERVLARTLESRPRDATHWSTRSMA